MTSNPIACPVCGSGESRSTVLRDRLAAMQNFVYRDREAAVNAKAGRFELRLCAGCGFAWNAAFLPDLLDYGQGYDNDVPSRVMTEYYEAIAHRLVKAYDLRGGLVVDVGCGKGTLLQILHRLYPDVRGLGIDPAYPGDLQPSPGLRFLREFFDAGQLQEKPALVICRHVAEHIPQPVPFFSAIHRGLRAFPGTPLFFEVPDAGWIVEQGAFWDFCYEHCNYFSPASLSHALEAAGFECGEHHRAFGDQYLWIDAATPGGKSSKPGQSPTLAANRENAVFQKALIDYARTESALFAEARDHLQSHRRAGKEVVIWGMATKGVVYSLLMDPDKNRIDHCVDKNANKQNCYVPLTAHRIEAPETLATRKDQPMVIVVMNPNYLAEIKQQCAAMALRADFVDAMGRAV